MTVEQLNNLFLKFYTEENLEKAKLLSVDILKVLNDEKLSISNKIEDEKDINQISFNDYFSTFQVKPNPNKHLIETIRLFSANSLKYSS